MSAGGRWGGSPWPSRVPLIYVIGAPIHPPPHSGELRRPRRFSRPPAPPRAASLTARARFSPHTECTRAQGHVALLLSLLLPHVVRAGGGPVPQEQVDALHAQFYGALCGMFHRHKHRHPAFRDAVLTVIDDHPPVTLSA